MNPTQVSSFQVDVDDPNFYNNGEDVINNDIANLKKSITIKRNLRIEAAEMEVETAALYLNIHWYELEEFKQLLEQKEEFVKMSNKLLASLNKRLTDMNLVVNNLAISSDYVYEFGTDQGQVIYTKDGTIYFFQQETNIDIPVSVLTETFCPITIRALYLCLIPYIKSKSNLIDKT
ncbi:hypothetical protein RR46_13531 [Papilio xuthus]|uniref:Uncharacterized protein n=1 Tax=Papilio xuthus TaxID=66420 RepID=A0A194PMG9_PAPXU|nr:hypothetical protein RR46_13531 [Papilio xuthus]